MHTHDATPIPAHAAAHSPGHAAAARGDWVEAERLFAGEAAEATTAGDDAALAAAMTNRGHALARLARVDEAADALSASVALRERLHAAGTAGAPVVARGLVDAAVVAATRGAADDALAMLERARSLAADAPAVAREVRRAIESVTGLREPDPVEGLSPAARDVHPQGAVTEDAWLLDATPDVTPDATALGASETGQGAPHAASEVQRLEACELDAAETVWTPSDDAPTAYTEAANASPDPAFVADAGCRATGSAAHDARDADVVRLPPGGGETRDVVARAAAHVARGETHPENAHPGGLAGLSPASMRALDADAPDADLGVETSPVSQRDASHAAAGLGPEWAPLAPGEPLPRATDDPAAADEPPSALAHRIAGLTAAPPPAPPAPPLIPAEYDDWAPAAPAARAGAAARTTRAAPAVTADATPRPWWRRLGLGRTRNPA